MTDKIDYKFGESAIGIDLIKTRGIHVVYNTIRCHLRNLETINQESEDLFMFCKLHKIERAGDFYHEITRRLQQIRDYLNNVYPVRPEINFSSLPK